VTFYFLSPNAETVSTVETASFFKSAILASSINCLFRQCTSPACSMDHNSFLYSLPTSPNCEGVPIPSPSPSCLGYLGTTEYLEEESAYLSASDEDESMSYTSESSMEEIFCPLYTFPTPPCQQHTTKLITSTHQNMTITPFTPHQRPVVSAPRHAYPHHGYSRSSLMHIKWFWHSRHTDWLNWGAGVTNQAYDGIDGELETSTDDYQTTDSHTVSPARPLCRNIISHSIAPSHYPQRLGDTTSNELRKFFFATDDGDDDHEGDDYEIVT
jgi:hypothetical protein